MTRFRLPVAFRSIFQRVTPTYLILSSHKIGGPQGAGAFVACSDLMMPKPLIVGGGQEKGFRAGTENLAAIAGFGAAAQEAAGRLARMEEVRALRDEIEKLDPVARAGCGNLWAKRAAACQHDLLRYPGVKAETAQIAFDLAGVALSAGSACSSGKVGPSHVLKAMGHDDPEGALRVSIGQATTQTKISNVRGGAVADCWRGAVDKGTQAA